MVCLIILPSLLKGKIPRLTIFLVGRLSVYPQNMEKQNLLFLNCPCNVGNDSVCPELQLNFPSVQSCFIPLPFRAAILNKHLCSKFHLSFYFWTVHSPSPVYPSHPRNKTYCSQTCQSVRRFLLFSLTSPLCLCLLTTV